VPGIGNGRDVDLLKQKLLRQQGLLAELEDALRALPVALRELDARLDASRARLEQARFELSATRATAPFSARVEQVSAARNQVVFPGQGIAILSEVGLYEITASVAVNEIAWLHHDIRPKALAEGVSTRAPVSRITCSADGFREARWGRVARLERIDELTRAARIVVEIDKPDDGAPCDSPADGHGLSLVSGMYCRVELPVEPQGEALCVPRGAMVDERYVYVAELTDPGDERSARLAIREVSVLRTLGESVLVDSRRGASGRSNELRFGDLLVVSPPSRPVPGMRVRPMRVDPPAVAEGR
jgi:multidrug efflux pump subunit AcrA (membrane-fusion protein)